MNTKQSTVVDDLIRKEIAAEAVDAVILASILDQSPGLSPVPCPLSPDPAPPVVHVVYFGGSDPRFSEVLGRWFEFFYASGCRWPVRVLTDMETSARAIGHIVLEQSLVRVEAAEFASVMRPGNAFDRKSAIICAALPHLPARSVVVDLDAFFMRDPSEVLLGFTALPFAMAEDAGGRWIPVIDEGGSIPEQSSSVMVFGGETRIPRIGTNDGSEPIPDNSSNSCRTLLVSEYVRAWKQLGVTPNQSGLESDIREQRAWSIVKHRVGAPILPRNCNDSRFWNGPTSSTLIYHAHGREKFGRA